MPTCQAFDNDCKGFVVGVGAAVLLMSLLACYCRRRYRDGRGFPSAHGAYDRLSTGGARLLEEAAAGGNRDNRTEGGKGPLKEDSMARFRMCNLLQDDYAAPATTTGPGKRHGSANGPNAGRAENGLAGGGGPGSLGGSASEDRGGQYHGDQAAAHGDSLEIDQGHNSLVLGVRGQGLATYVLPAGAGGGGRLEGGSFSVADVMDPRGAPAFTGPGAGTPMDTGARRLCVAQWEAGAADCIRALLYAELQAATVSFSVANRVGKGGSCSVYQVLGTAYVCEDKSTSDSNRQSRGGQLRGRCSC